MVQVSRPAYNAPILEAHGTGTGLGDPIEAKPVMRELHMLMLACPQVGAAIRALCGQATR